MLTTCRSEVSDSTCPAAGLPRLPGTLVTRIASGSNTTDLAASDPDGLEIPTADCSASTAAFVSHEKWPAAGSEVGVAFIARGPAPPRDAVCPQAYARRHTPAGYCGIVQMGPQADAPCLGLGHLFP
jgi:hypothetical protein